MDSVVRICLAGIEGRGYHGVLPREREVGQEFVVDVEVDVRRGSLDDALDTTLDYGGLATRIVSRIEGEPVQLIETLAERIAGDCLDHPRVERARVVVHKPHAPIPVPFGDVRVEVVRRRDGGLS